MQTKKITVVVPAYNEGAVLPLFFNRLMAVLEDLPGYAFTLLFVDDGSTDDTRALLHDYQAADLRVRVLGLTRNFGKEAAVAAGFDYADGDAVILMDADLQDPPELIPKLIEGWERGYDDVYAKRLSREGEGLLKKGSAALYYRLLRRLSPVPVQEDTGDFRLLDRQCVLAIRRLRESGRCFKSIFSWVGYRKLAVPFVRPARAAGKTKWGLAGLVELAGNGIASLSTAPLRWPFGAAALLLGAAVLLFLGLWLGRGLSWGGGLCVLLLFLGGLFSFFLGVLGEYVGRALIEARHRPLYLVEEEPR